MVYSSSNTQKILIFLLFDSPNQVINILLYKLYIYTIVEALHLLSNQIKKAQFPINPQRKFVLFR